MLTTSTAGSRSLLVDPYISLSATRPCASLESHGGILNGGKGRSVAFLEKPRKQTYAMTVMDPSKEFLLKGEEVDNTTEG